MKQRSPTWLPAATMSSPSHAPPVGVAMLSFSGSAFLSPNCQSQLQFHSQHPPSCSNLIKIAAECFAFSLYCPPPSHKNRLKDSMFLDQFPEFLDSCNSLPGQLCILGDFNIPFDHPHDPITANTLDILNMQNLQQTVVCPLTDMV